MSHYGHSFIASTTALNTADLQLLYCVLNYIICWKREKKHESLLTCSIESIQTCDIWRLTSERCRWQETIETYKSVNCQSLYPKLGERYLRLIPNEGWVIDRPELICWSLINGHSFKINKLLSDGSILYSNFWNVNNHNFIKALRLNKALKSDKNKTQKYSHYYYCYYHYLLLLWIY